MDEVDYVLEGTDDVGAYNYRIGVQEFDKPSAEGMLELVVGVTSIDLYESETHNSHGFILNVYGRVNESNRESFLKKLERKGVPVVARNKTASALFDKYVNVNVRVMIEIEKFEYHNRMNIDEEEAPEEEDPEEEDPEEEDPEEEDLEEEDPEEDEMELGDPEEDEIELGDLEEEDHEEEEWEEVEEQEGFFYSAPIPARREAVEALERVTVAQGKTCAICMDDMSESMKMPCGHDFHENCLLAWLQYRCHCPLCRFSLPSSTAT